MSHQSSLVSTGKAEGWTLEQGVDLIVGQVAWNDGYRHAAFRGALGHHEGDERSGRLGCGVGTKEREG